MPRRSRLKKAMIDFVSFVPRGAHQGAEVVLMKHDVTDEGEGDVFKMQPDSSDVMPSKKKKKDDEDLTAEDLGLDEEGDGEEDSTDEEQDPEKPKKMKKGDVTNSGDQSPTLPNNTEGKHMPQDIDLTTYTPEALIKYVEDLEEVVISKEAEIEALKSIDFSEGDDSSEGTDDLLAKVDDPALAEYIRTMIAKADNAETLAKAEREARISTEMLAKAEDLEVLGIEPNEMADLLKDIHEADADLFDRVHDVLTKSAAVIDTLDIFDEIGKSASESTIGGDLEGVAKGLQASDPTLTTEQAIAKALEARPDLYDPTNANGGN